MQESQQSNITINDLNKGMNALVDHIHRLDKEIDEMKGFLRDQSEKKSDKNLVAIHYIELSDKINELQKHVGSHNWADMLNERITELQKEHYDNHEHLKKEMQLIVQGQDTQCVQIDKLERRLEAKTWQGYEDCRGAVGDLKKEFEYLEERHQALNESVTFNHAKKLTEIEKYVDKLEDTLTFWINEVSTYKNMSNKFDDRIINLDNRAEQAYRWLRKDFDRIEALEKSAKEPSPAMHSLTERVRILESMCPSPIKDTKSDITCHGGGGSGDYTGGAARVPNQKIKIEWLDSPATITCHGSGGSGAGGSGATFGCLTFNQALDYIKRGKSARRAAWCDPTFFINSRLLEENAIEACLDWEDLTTEDWIVAL